jgi:hypothetical protein
VFEHVQLQFLLGGETRLPPLDSRRMAHFARTSIMNGYKERVNRAENYFNAAVNSDMEPHVAA